MVKDDSSGFDKIIAYDMKATIFIIGGSKDGEEREEIRGSVQWDYDEVRGGMLLLSVYRHVRVFKF